MNTQTQKFKRGDLVRIAKNLGPHMSHFRSDMDAIVLGSYADQYGGDNRHSYSLILIPLGGESSWYNESQLAFIGHVGEDGIIQARTEYSQSRLKQQDLHWILKHWTELRNNAPGATCDKLMAMAGITNPWGPNGEGFAWHENAMRAIGMLDRALSTGDIDALNAFLISRNLPTV